MTPKEKAFELFNKYLKILGGINSTDWVYFHGEEAKQCALIAVDEKLKIFSQIYNILVHKNIVDVELKYTATYKYWEEVKQEIEKL
jgi:hypothetical protein